MSLRIAASPSTMSRISSTTMRDAAAVVGVDDDLERPRGSVSPYGAQVLVEPDDRQDRAAVLHDLAVADLLDASRRAPARAG